MTGQRGGGRGVWGVLNSHLGRSCEKNIATHTPPHFTGIRFSNKKRTQAAPSYYWMGSAQVSRAAAAQDRQGGRALRDWEAGPRQQETSVQEPLDVGSEWCP